MNIRKDKIQSIQYLRACAALIVFLCHFYSELNTKVNFVGRFGVAFFFIISGYLLASPSSESMKHYWKKKIVRIVPLYWISTLLVFVVGVLRPSLLHTAVPTISNLLKSLFFIPFYTKGVEGIFPLYPIAWTLTCEVYVYLIFWIARKFVRKYSLTCVISSAFIILVTILGSVVQNKNLFLDTYGKNYVAFFAVGILIRAAEQYIPLNIREKIPQIKSVGWIGASTGVVVMVVLSMNYSETVGYFIIIPVIFILAILLGGGTEFPYLFIRLGNISYSFYLVHYFVVKGFTRVLLKQNTTNLFTSSCGAVICIIVTYVIAIISWNLIEVKLSDFLKKNI